jgi:hypothetical protein
MISVAALSPGSRLGAPSSDPSDSQYVEITSGGLQFDSFRIVGISSFTGLWKDCPFERSRPAADAAREVNGAVLLDG